MANRFNLLDFAYAHRGLWSQQGHPENSLEAIVAAGTAGLGCEFDVRPAACGTPVVFHDSLLDRMTDRSGLVAGHSAEELTQIDLKGGGKIPTLGQVLDVWRFAGPLLVELKIDGETDAEGFAAIVAELIDGFDGPAAMMSFSRRAVDAIPASISRGALVLPSSLSEDVTLHALISTSAALKPDYLACHVSDAVEASSLATDYGLPVVAWTVASAEVSGELKPYPVAQIFEGFDPALVRP